MLNRMLAVMSGAALALALLPGVASAREGRQPVSLPLAGPQVSQPTAAGQVLVRQRATLTQHATGHPKPGTPAKWRIARATVDVEVLSSLFIHAYVDLADVDPDENAWVSVQFGHRASNGACNAAPRADKWIRTDSYARQRHLHGYSPDSWGPKPTTPWNCVIALVEDPSGNIVDAMVGSLVNTYEAPKLALGTLAVLGQTQKKLKVSAGGWTPVEVRLANRGTRATGRVNVTAVGRGLKIKRGSLDRLGKKSSGSTTIYVRPVGRKKPNKIKVTARAAGGVVATRTYRVQKVKPPKKPVAGKYRAKPNSVNFRISKGRVSGFRVTTWTRCGGYGSIPTGMYSTYNFPTRKIPRNGILTATTKGKAYGTPWGASLRLRVSGKSVTRGLFRYHGPGGCSASVPFTAKRAGR